MAILSENLKSEGGRPMREFTKMEWEGIAHMAQAYCSRAEMLPVKRI